MNRKLYENHLPFFVYKLNITAVTSLNTCTVGHMDTIFLRMELRNNHKTKHPVGMLSKLLTIQPSTCHLA